MSGRCLGGIALKKTHEKKRKHEPVFCPKEAHFPAPPGAARFKYAKIDEDELNKDYDEVCDYNQKAAYAGKYWNPNPKPTHEISMSELARVDRKVLDLLDELEAALLERAIVYDTHGYKGRKLLGFDPSSNEMKPTKPPYKLMEAHRLSFAPDEEVGRD